MPNSYNLPDHAVVVAGTPERRIKISGSGDFTVDGEQFTEPVVVDKAVQVQGQGYVVTEEAEPKKAPRKPRPSEKKKKKA